MKKILELFKKYKEIILYLIFGGLTTLVNIICYFLMYEVFGISNMASTVVSLIVSILFAFVTNKVYVFQSKTVTKKAALKEAFSFFFFRLLTGVLDVLIMYIAVDVMAMSGTLW